MQQSSDSLPEKPDLGDYLLKQLFRDKYGRPRKTPVHAGQVRVLFEEYWNPWQIDDALKALTIEGAISTLRQSATYAGEVTFYYPSEIGRDQNQTRLVELHARSLMRLINLYLSPRITNALGEHLEGLVKYELRTKGFEIVGESTREYNGRRWTKTRDNLDIVAIQKSRGLAIGVEVKNTLDLIERTEVEVKMEICEHLGLIPLFATRWIKPRADLISGHNGISWEFKNQIYPPGFENLVRTIFRRFSLAWNETKGRYLYPMPVEVRTDLPARATSIRGLEL